MKIYKHVFVVLISLISTMAFAQDVLNSNIEWKSNSTFDVASGVISDENTKVVTSSSQIVWYDNGGATKQTLDIVSADGTWSNVANNGSISFKVTTRGSSGIVQLKKNGATRSIRIHIVNDDESMIYELTINEVNAL